MRIRKLLPNNVHGLLPIIGLMAILFITACGTEGDTSEAENTSPTMEQNEQVQTQPNNQTQTTVETQQNNSMSQVTDENGDVVFHFVCPNGCEGSGGPGKAPCPVCGEQYVHNSEYHQYQRQQQPQSNQPAAVNPQSDGQIQMDQPSATNAQGEFHFICPEGCEGGSATKTTCGNCGADLVHNDAYHN